MIEMCNAAICLYGNMQDTHSSWTAVVVDVFSLNASRRDAAVSTKPNIEGQNTFRSVFLQESVFAVHLLMRLEY